MSEYPWNENNIAITWLSFLYNPFKAQLYLHELELIKNWYGDNFFRPRRMFSDGQFFSRGIISVNIYSSCTY